jgi:hypothetical protein
MIAHFRYARLIPAITPFFSSASDDEVDARDRPHKAGHDCQLREFGILLTPADF